MSICHSRGRGGCCREQGSVEEAQLQWRLRHVVELVEAQPQWRMIHVYTKLHTLVKLCCIFQCLTFCVVSIVS